MRAVRALEGTAVTLGWVLLIAVGAIRLGVRPHDTSVGQVIAENTMLAVVLLAGVVSAISAKVVAGPHPFRRAVLVAASLVLICGMTLVGYDGPSGEGYLPTDQQLVDLALLAFLALTTAVAGFVWLYRYRWRHAFEV